MTKTLIPWADHTINPIVGCSKCSPGCERCYAEKFAARLAKNPNPKVAAKYAGVVKDGKWTGKINYDPSALDNLPSKPSRIFVCSMGDICHENFDAQLDIYFRFAKSPHTFLLLTKRPERFNILRNAAGPLPNVWLGVTVCNQQEADEKIPILLNTPAAKRFVSIEPMLGPVDLSKWLTCACNEYWPGQGHPEDCPTQKLHWIIVGGETGPGARPMEADWARAVRDQCKEARVPFFFKKMGGKKPTPDDLMIREVPE
jgi:protein gp37